MATTTTTNAATDGTKGVRNFKQTSDVENFYRFVYESKFRREALIMMKVIHGQIAAANKKKKSKSKKVLQ
ncbi:MAG: hypothetical protein ACPGJV_03235 [Bacteriovoracaceae bacterium]